MGVILCEWWELYSVNGGWKLYYVSGVGWELYIVSAVEHFHFN